MPAIPGENLLTTLFADVHYYFNDPSSKPLHHRFSKGSYAYIYYNPAEHRAKLEVANHAGTPDQDAFSGYMSAVQQVRYSYKQPTLYTVTLVGQSPQNEWHLPSYDERNEQRFLYKIHTLDIYLWTEKDAATFLGHLKAVLPSEKLDIRDAPASTTEALPAEHRDSMSPVVQQLEKTAVGTHFPPRAESTASGHSFPGPPTPSTGAAVSPPPQQQQQQQQPSPFAYNPAAPAAPEPIAHREKTPPPVEDGSGPGLSGSRAPPPPHMQFAQHQGFQPSQSNTPQQSYFPGMHQQRQPSSSSMHVPGPSHGTPPGGMQRHHSGSLPPPPPPPGSGPSPSQYAPSFGPPPTDQGTQHPTSPPPNQASFNRQSIMGQPTQQYASYPSQQQFATYQPQSPGFNPSVQSPGMPPTPGFMQQQQQQQPPTPSAPPHYNTHTPLQSPGFPPHTPGLPPPPTGQPPAQQNTPPVGGYSSYNYSQGAQAAPGAYNPHGAYTGDAHVQAYRPTEAEVQARPTQQQASDGGKESFSGKYKVNDRVDKVEKGVGRFLKKLDSKW